GAVLPLVALCIVVLLAMLALAIDIGMLAVARCQAQNAADAAAMAGARAINGDTANNYNFAGAPKQAVAGAVANEVLGMNIQGDPNNLTQTNSYTFQSGGVEVQVGSYAYIYNAADPAQEGFEVQFPRQSTSEPYSAVRATVTTERPFAF